MFLNILNNAVDAVIDLQKTGELWVRSSHDTDANRLIIEFIDNGSGVKEVPKVFDPFYTTKPVGKGTGLGLSICYGIVTEHGGEIFVRNVPPRGACFTILLPLTVVADPKQSENRDVGETGGQGRILLIDREDAVLELEREILKPHYRNVYAVRNAPEALRLLEAEQFDLVITEWKSGGEFSGQQFYDWICRFRPELGNRLIFTLSGTATSQDFSKEIQQACLFLRKPFRVDEFLNVVRNALNAKDVTELRR